VTGPLEQKSEWTYALRVVAAADGAAAKTVGLLCACLGKIARLVVDRAADGRAITAEIIDPSQCSPDRLVALLQSLGLP
jgi:hypothetical protein